MRRQRKKAKGRAGQAEGEVAGAAVQGLGVEAARQGERDEAGGGRGRRRDQCCGPLRLGVPIRIYEDASLVK